MLKCGLDNMTQFFILWLLIIISGNYVECQTDGTKPSTKIQNDVFMEQTTVKNIISEDARHIIFESSSSPTIPSFIEIENESASTTHTKEIASQVPDNDTLTTDSLYMESTTFVTLSYENNSTEFSNNTNSIQLDSGINSQIKNSIEKNINEMLLEKSMAAKNKLLNFEESKINPVINNVDRNIVNNANFQNNNIALLEHSKTNTKITNKKQITNNENQAKQNKKKRISKVNIPVNSMIVTKNITMELDNETESELQKTTLNYTVKPEETTEPLQNGHSRIEITEFAEKTITDYEFTTTDYIEDSTLFEDFVGDIFTEYTDITTDITDSYTDMDIDNQFTTELPEETKKGFSIIQDWLKQEKTSQFESTSSITPSEFTDIVPDDSIQLKSSKENDKIQSEIQKIVEIEEATTPITSTHNTSALGMEISELDKEIAEIDKELVQMSTIGSVQDVTKSEIDGSTSEQFQAATMSSTSSVPTEEFTDILTDDSIQLNASKENVKSIQIQSEMQKTDKIEEATTPITITHHTSALGMETSDKEIAELDKKLAQTSTIRSVQEVTKPEADGSSSEQFQATTTSSILTESITIEIGVTKPIEEIMKSQIVPSPVQLNQELTASSTIEIKTLSGNAETTIAPETMTTERKIDESNGNKIIEVSKITDSEHVSSLVTPLITETVITVTESSEPTKEVAKSETMNGSTNEITQIVPSLQIIPSSETIISTQTMSSSQTIPSSQTMTSSQTIYSSETIPLVESNQEITETKTIEKKQELSELEKENNRIEAVKISNSISRDQPDKEIIKSEKDIVQSGNFGIETTVAAVLTEFITTEREMGISETITEATKEMAEIEMSKEVSQADKDTFEMSKEISQADNDTHEIESEIAQLQKQIAKLQNLRKTSANVQLKQEINKTKLTEFIQPENKTDESGFTSEQDKETSLKENEANFSINSTEELLTTTDIVNTNLGVEEIKIINEIVDDILRNVVKSNSTYDSNEEESEEVTNYKIEETTTTNFETNDTEDESKINDLDNSIDRESEQLYDNNSFTIQSIEDGNIAEIAVDKPNFSTANQVIDDKNRSEISQSSDESLNKLEQTLNHDIENVGIVEQTNTKDNVSKIDHRMSEENKSNDKIIDDSIRFPANSRGEIIDSEEVKSDGSKESENEITSLKTSANSANSDEESLILSEESDVSDEENVSSSKAMTVSPIIVPSNDSTTVSEVVSVPSETIMTTHNVGLFTETVNLQANNEEKIIEEIEDEIMDDLITKEYQQIEKNEEIIDGVFKGLKAQIVSNDTKKLLENQTAYSTKVIEDSKDTVIPNKKTLELIKELINIKTDNSLKENNEIEVTTNIVGEIDATTHEEFTTIKSDVSIKNIFSLIAKKVIGNESNADVISEENMDILTVTENGLSESIDQEQMNEDVDNDTTTDDNLMTSNMIRNNDIPVTTIISFMSENENSKYENGFIEEILEELTTEKIDDSNEDISNNAETTETKKKAMVKKIEQQIEDLTNDDIENKEDDIIEKIEEELDVLNEMEDQINLTTMETIIGSDGENKNKLFDEEIRNQEQNIDNVTSEMALDIVNNAERGGKKKLSEEDDVVSKESEDLSTENSTGSSMQQLMNISNNNSKMKENIKNNEQEDDINIYEQKATLEESSRLINEAVTKKQSSETNITSFDKPNERLVNAADTDRFVKESDITKVLQNIEEALKIQEELEKSIEPIVDLNNVKSFQTSNSVNRVSIPKDSQIDTDSKHVKPFEQNSNENIADEFSTMLTEHENTSVGDDQNTDKLNVSTELFDDLPDFDMDSDSVEIASNSDSVEKLNFQQLNKEFDDEDIQGNVDMQKNDSKVTDTVALKDIEAYTSSYVKSSSDGLNFKSSVYEDNPYITGNVMNKFDEQCLAYNMSLKVIINNTIKRIPKNALVLANCSGASTHLKITWRSMEGQEVNDTLHFIIKNGDNNAYIDSIQIEIMNTTGKTIKAERNNLESLSSKSGDIIQIPPIIDFDNNIELNLQIANLQVHTSTYLNSVLSEELSKAFALQIASASVFLLVILIAIGYLVYRKTKSKIRIFKVAMDK